MMAPEFSINDGRNGCQLVYIFTFTSLVKDRSTGHLAKLKDMINYALQIELAILQVPMEKSDDIKGKMPLRTGSDDGASGSVQTQDHELRSNALGGQGSPYSLTLNDVQNHVGDLGEPLDSMNLDELFKFVLTAESSQGMGGVDYGFSSQLSQGALGAPLQQQSNVVLSRDLSEKSVHEERRDIQQGLKSGSIDCEAQEKQATLGALTLEDFMVKAGVLAETAPAKNDFGSVLGVDPIPLPFDWRYDQMQSNHQSQPWLQYQQQNMVPVLMPWQPVQPTTPSNVSSMVGVAYPHTQITMSATTFPGTLFDMQTPERKRVASGDVVEQLEERRQRRRLKNREAAIRSQKKKKAYLRELENTVVRLREENGKLKKKKEVLEMLSSLPTPERKYQLRRTSSAFF